MTLQKIHIHTRTHTVQTDGRHADSHWTEGLAGPTLNAEKDQSIHWLCWCYFAGGFFFFFNVYWVVVNYLKSNIFLCRKSTKIARSSPRLCLKLHPRIWSTWASTSSATHSRTSEMRKWVMGAKNFNNNNNNNKNPTCIQCSLAKLFHATFEM